MKRKNLPMASTDYKKVYDLVPQSWIIDCLQMYKLSGEVIKFIENTIKKKLESRTSSRRQKLNKGENSVGNLPGSTYLRNAQDDTNFIHRNKKSTTKFN